MSEPDDRLLAALRRSAAELDERAPAITADEARSRTVGSRRPPRQLRPAVAAVLLVVLVAASAWALMDDDGGQTTVVAPGPEESSITDRPSTTGDPGADVFLEDWFEWDALPTEGVAVLDADGTMTLHDLVGDVLASGPFSGETSGSALWVLPGDIQPASGGMAEVPPGCASAEAAGGIRVARCGDDPDQPDRIELVDPAGSATVLDLRLPSAADTDPVLGHWRRAFPSSDGRWVLAEWSGECEIPEAVLFEVSNGAAMPVAEPVGGHRPSSQVLAWTIADGRALVVLPESGCGTTAADAGVRLLEPTTGTFEQVLPPPAPGSQVFHWTKRAPGNDPERLVAAAIDQLGFEGCCGEPSHGGPGVMSGAVFEGHQIGFGGAPIEVAEELPAEARVPFLHGEAAVARGFEGMRIVQFRCGGFVWSLSWWDEEPAEVDSMVLLGEAIVPHLGCTLGEPPAG